MGKFVSVLLGLALAAPVALATSAYRCQSGGSVTYSQFPCRAADVQKLRIGAPNVVKAPPLSDAERRQLHEQQRESLDRRRRRAETKRRTQRQIAKAQATSAQRCTASQQQLGELQQTMRRGYPLKDAVRLKAKRSRLKGLVASHC